MTPVRREEILDLRTYEQMRDALYGLCNARREG